MGGYSSETFSREKHENWSRAMNVQRMSYFKAHYECSEELDTIARPARQSAKNQLLFYDPSTALILIHHNRFVVSTLLVHKYAHELQSEAHVSSVIN